MFPGQTNHTLLITKQISQHSHSKASELMLFHEETGHVTCQLLPGRPTVMSTDFYESWSKYKFKHLYYHCLDSHYEIYMN